MNFKKRGILLVRSAKAGCALSALVLAWVFLPLHAEAATTWLWFYSGHDIKACGTLQTADAPNSSGFYKVTDISGRRGDDKITALFPAGKWIPGNVGYPVDNLLSGERGAQLTMLGLGYSLASGAHVNIYYKKPGKHRKHPGYGEVRTTASSVKESPIEFEAATLAALEHLPKLRNKARGCYWR